MGKNKNKKNAEKYLKKDKTFSVVRPKKGSTTSVSSNLKKLNLQTKSKTEKADSNFKAVQAAVLDAAKTSSAKPKTFSKKKTPKTHDAPVDMDTAADAFARL